MPIPAVSHALLTVSCAIPVQIAFPVIWDSICQEEPAQTVLLSILNAIDAPLLQPALLAFPTSIRQLETALNASQDVSLVQHPLIASLAS